MTAPLMRHARAGLLLAGLCLLAGCIYDPYTGTYRPCCGNPYPAYAYPAYPPYGSYPYRPPPRYPASGYPYRPPPRYPPSDYAYPTQPYGYAPADTVLARRFAAANITHDGRLTLEQAQQANWRAVARNFPAIDVDRKGYVTPAELRAWFAIHRPPPFGAPE